MSIFKNVKSKFAGMHPLCLTAVQMGIALMVACYISALIALRLAGEVPDYFYAMSLYRGALETAPACLAAGVCAALLGDMMLGNKRYNDDNTGSKK